MSQPSPPSDPGSVIHAWQRLRFALGAAGIGTWHLDLRTRIITYDESMNRIFGLQPIESRTPMDERLARLHPDDRERVRATIDEAIAHRAEFSLEFRIVRPDGVVLWLRDRGRIIVDDKGTPIIATGAAM